MMRRKYKTQVELALMLGVSRGVVHMWAKRRERNGFPESVAAMPDGRPLYDPAEVKRWHKKYVPSKGGRPAAAHNLVK